MAIIICLATVLFIMGIIKFVETAYSAPKYDIYIKKDGHLGMRRRGGITDYGCREDFSQRFEDDPWSMFRS